MENKVKYPRTKHLPWSLGVSRDDLVADSAANFEGKRVIVTEKMDGENTTMYADAVYARSVDSVAHVSRSWVRAFWASIRHDIPEGWRVCGENVYAQHSIRYENLPSYFLGFSIWNERNDCICWDATVEYLGAMGITPVRVLYDGIYNEAAIKALWKEEDGTEGYVIRLADGFSFEEFGSSVAKFVRAGHVTTDEHWMNRSVERNGLA